MDIKKKLKKYIYITIFKEKTWVNNNNITGPETSAVFKAKTIILLLYTGIKSLQLAAI